MTNARLDLEFSLPDFPDETRAARARSFWMEVVE